MQKTRLRRTSVVLALVMTLVCAGLAPDASSQQGGLIKRGVSGQMYIWQTGSC